MTRAARVLALAAALLAGGCGRAPFRVGSLDRLPPAFSAATQRSDHQLIECVQRQWEDRGAAVATQAQPAGVTLVARSAVHSTRLYASADIVAFAPERQLTIRTRHGHAGFAAAARACL